MKIQELRIENIVVGTGAAGFQAALRLRQNGETDLAIIAEHINAGTSRNTGSDKQTYYKLSLASGDLDSVRNMAEDLFAGQCVDGDQALCEAALSIRSFFRLVELGVPFPCTEYGEFMGYKTDHDRGRRATSAGPYTSRRMTECLEKSVKEHKIKILDQVQVIYLLVKEAVIYGILCIDKKEKEEASYLLIWCSNVILATGGPAGIYYNSVYPISQMGSSGLAFEAGVKGKNLTEWQFGLASLKPRWNVSGTYMQALPRFLSTDQNGDGEREFLFDYFETPEEMLSMIFMKGYQWPFDVNKIYGGSSVIDLLVYQETVLKGRRVYLDFTKNTGNRAIAFQKLSLEAYDYLRQANALYGTPIERLKQMNEPAIRFYQDHHVDLYQDKLEIAVCAQHNNGGLATDAYWETNIHGLFAIGEVCGSHGVTRPGGTALNAGQVGAMRAAECIHLRKLHAGNFSDKNKDRDKDRDKGRDKNSSLAEIEQKLRLSALEYIDLVSQACGNREYHAVWTKAAKRMSAYGGMIRDIEKLKNTLEETNRELADYLELVKKPSVAEIPFFYRLRDILISQKMYLSAMIDYSESGAGSRGSALYTDKNGRKPDLKMPDLYKCTLDEGAHAGIVQEISMNGMDCNMIWRSVRPIPEVDYFFENQWKGYREREGLSTPDA